MKKCVIFDMDGVIIDSEPFHQECERKMFQMFGITVSEKEHNTFVGATDENIWSCIKSSYSLSISVSDAVKLKKSLYREYMMNEALMAPIPHVSDLITELYENGFSLAVASSAPMEQIQHVINSFGLADYFKSFVSGEDVSKGKPNPDIFLKAADLIGSHPNCCVVIEDSHNGITAAISANMKCIGYKNQNSGNQDLSKANLIVDSLQNLSSTAINELFYCCK